MLYHWAMTTALISPFLICLFFHCLIAQVLYTLDINHLSDICLGNTDPIQKAAFILCCWIWYDPTYLLLPVLGVMSKTDAESKTLKPFPYFFPGPLVLKYKIFPPFCSPSTLVEDLWPYAGGFTADYSVPLFSMSLFMPILDCLDHCSSVIYF